VTIPGGENGNEPLTCGPSPVKFIFKFPNCTQSCKFKKEVFPSSKNTQTFYAARFEYLEYLLYWADIVFSSEFNLNLP
jgi:hypothetical protein